MWQESSGACTGVSSCGGFDYLPKWWKRLHVNTTDLFFVSCWIANA